MQIVRSIGQSLAAAFTMAASNEAALMLIGQTLQPQPLNGIALATSVGASAGVLMKFIFDQAQHSKVEPISLANKTQPSSEQHQPDEDSVGNQTKPPFSILDYALWHRIR